MYIQPIRDFQSAAVRADGWHAYVTEDGAFLGPGVPLLEKDAFGNWRPRPQPVLERLLDLGYGVQLELGWRIGRLATVARALDKGDLRLAAIALVHAELPPLAHHERARWMAWADGIIRCDEQRAA